MPPFAPRRLLYLTKVYPYPPATAGDAVYSRGIIEALATSCELTVLCADSGAERRHPQGINWQVTGPQRPGKGGSVLSRWPLIAWKSATSDYRAALARLLQESWDGIVLDNLGLAHALPEAERYRADNPDTKLIYVSHEYEYPTRQGKYGSYKLGLAKRLVAKRDLIKVKSSEEALLKSCDIVTVINKADLEPFRKIAPARKYLSFAPGYNGPKVMQRQISKDTPDRILLLGGRRSEQKRRILLDWMELAYEPLNAAGIEMVIVGDMDDSLREILKTRFPKTQALGFVDDLDALIASARMGVIADTVGGGFKMRLQSHVFQRLPIVGLSGAISGLETAEGEGYLGAETLTELLDLVCEVTPQIDRLNAIQEKAFHDSKDAYSWPSRATDFLNALGPNAEKVLL